MSTVRLRGPVQVVRPKFVRFFDLIRSFPDQARLALGTRGVVWATAAGVVGLVCCAVSMAAVALSLHATEAGYTRHKTSDLLALDQSTRRLMYRIHLMTYDQVQPVEAGASLRQGMGTVRSGVDGGLWRGFRRAIPRRSPARDLRRRHRHLRSAGGRDRGLRAAGPPARPRDAGSGDRPARTPERRECCGCEQRRCADRQAGRRLRAGAACPDAQHGRFRLRRAGADPAGRPCLDGASAAMAGRRRGARPPAGDDRQPAGGRRGLRPERAAGDVQCRRRRLDAAAEAARHHRHLLRGVGAGNRQAVAGVRRAAREHGRGMDRAFPQQGHADHAPGGRRTLVRMVGEAHAIRPDGRSQGRRHRPQEARDGDRACARSASGNDRCAAGGRRALRQGRAAGDVQQGRRLHCAAHRPARRHRQDLQPDGVRNRARARRHRSGAGRRRQGVDRALSLQGHTAPASGAGRPLGRVAGEGHAAAAARWGCGSTSPISRTRSSRSSAPAPTISRWSIRSRTWSTRSIRRVSSRSPVPLPSTCWSCRPRPWSAGALPISWKTRIWSAPLPRRALTCDRRTMGCVRSICA